MYEWLREKIFIITTNWLKASNKTRLKFFFVLMESKSLKKGSNLINFEPIIHMEKH